ASRAATAGSVSPTTSAARVSRRAFSKSPSRVSTSRPASARPLVTHRRPDVTVMSTIRHAERRPAVVGRRGVAGGSARGLVASVLAAGLLAHVAGRLLALLLGLGLGGLRRFGPAAP